MQLVGGVVFVDLEVAVSLTIKVAFSVGSWVRDIARRRGIIMSAMVFSIDMKSFVLYYDQQRI